MKKILITMFVCLFLSGCLDVKTEITIRDDDSGTIVYTVAMAHDEETEFLEESENAFADYEGASIKEIEYRKNDLLYEGEEVTINFNSLEELNEILLVIFEGTDDSQVKATRNGNRVTIFVPSDPEEFDEMFGESEVDLSEIYDFQFIVQVEGTVVENNADQFNQNTNIMTWKTENFFQNGINLVYDTSGDPQPIIDDNGEDEIEGSIDDDNDDKEGEKESMNLMHLAIIAGGAAAIGAIVYLKRK